MGTTWQTRAKVVRRDRIPPLRSADPGGGITSARKRRTIPHHSKPLRGAEQDTTAGKNGSKAGSNPASDLSFVGEYGVANGTTLLIGQVTRRRSAGFLRSPDVYKRLKSVLALPSVRREWVV